MSDRSDELRRHFAQTSRTWSERYSGAPATVSDLDLVLRRANVQSLLMELLEEHPGTLEALDIGCGTGDMLDGISRSRVCVSGFDLAPEMVGVASNRHPEDDYRVADAFDLPLEPGSKDVVLCVGVLEYLDDVDRVLAGIREELRADGVLIVSYPNGNSWLRRVGRWIHRLEDALGRLTHGAESGPPALAHRSWHPRQARALLERHGFEIRCARYNTFGIGGWLGRRPLALALSRCMTRRFSESTWVGERFAMTLVYAAAVRPPPPTRSGRDPCGETASPARCDRVE